VVVKVQDVRIGGHGPWSFQVDEGERVAVVAGSSWARLALLSLLTGRQRPEAGRVRLLGEDLYAASGATALALFRDVGVVREGGGLVSNLRAWENVLLPASYHAGLAGDEVLPRAQRHFERLGLRDDALADCLDSLPGLLPGHWRRIVGLVRALVMEPRLMLYEAPLDGLPAALARAVADVTAGFHDERPGRTSLYLVTEASGTLPLAVGRTIGLGGDQA
jgi:ABC-type transporter Mla maintaining outer membrane lipid asymmetry ATPase subunit MlaF